jgi:hypothetical protein
MTGNNWGLPDFRFWLSPVPEVGETEVLVGTVDGSVQASCRQNRVIGCRPWWPLVARPWWPLKGTEELVDPDVKWHAARTQEPVLPADGRDAQLVGSGDQPWVHPNGPIHLKRLERNGV